MKQQGKRIEEKAYQAGYRVTEQGDVISPYSGKPLKLWMRKHGYMSFSYDHTDKVWVHRLQAFQKYGERIYEKGIQVRHLNGDSLDNRAENIAIGTQSDNMMDRRPEDRIAHAKHAASHIRKLSNEDVVAMREARAAGAKLSELCRRYGMSMGGISDIVTGKQRADVGGPITPTRSRQSISAEYGYVVGIKGKYKGQTMFYDDDDEDWRNGIFYPGSFLEGGYIIAPLSDFRHATAAEIDAHERSGNAIGRDMDALDAYFAGFPHLADRLFVASLQKAV